MSVKRVFLICYNHNHEIQSMSDLDVLKRDRLWRGDFG